ncbi:MAG: DUF2100 domain-containing protein [Methanobrevibacter sp.]|jgi:hypothetical protein|nr:DUF2100 domain-containing protein [Methanobrevibacter sp.]
MENIRLKQAQNLIEKTAGRNKEEFKLKDPQAGHIDSKKFENVFESIIPAEDFLYRSLPNHNLSKEEAEKFTRYLLLARENIDSILSDFKVIEKKEEEIDINKITSKYLFITTKNNFKKLLKKLGVDVQRIIVSGVPLKVEDMKKINPKIPDAALKGIGKKVEHVNNDIQRKNSSLNPEKIFVLAEDDVTGNLLGQRAKEEYNAIIYLDNQLKDLTDEGLINLIENN